MSQSFISEAGGASVSKIHHESLCKALSCKHLEEKYGFLRPRTVGRGVIDTRWRTEGRGSGNRRGWQTGDPAHLGTVLIMRMLRCGSVSVISQPETLQILLP